MTGEDEHTTGRPGQDDLVRVTVEIAAPSLQVGSTMAAGHQPGCTVVLGEVDERHDGGESSGLIDIREGEIIGVKLLLTEAGERATKRELADVGVGAENRFDGVDHRRVGQDLFGCRRKTIDEVDQASCSGKRLVADATLVADVRQPFKTAAGQAGGQVGRQDVR